MTAMVIYIVWGLIGHTPWASSPLLSGEVASGLVLASVPFLLERIFHFQFPDVEVFIFLIFILMAILLGSGMGFYSVPYWDKYEHALSSMMEAGLAYGVFGALTKPKSRLETTSPFLMSLFAFTFGTAIGTCWEFYEFTVDGLFGMNLQRYMTNAGRLLPGRAALMDTMGDLLCDAGGSLLIAIIGYLCIKHNRAWLDKFLFKATK